MAVVTIRGRMGSGAIEIGRQIAYKLHAAFIDREITTGIAQILHCSEKRIKEKEIPPVTLKDHMEAFFNVISFLNVDDYSYFMGLQSVIKELAVQPSVVIFGRGSQFILKDHPRSFHILTVAPLELRIKRIVEDSDLSEDQAKSRILAYDSRYQKFTRKYFAADAEYPAHYDMVINTAYLSIKDAVSIVINAIPHKMSRREYSNEEGKTR